MTELRESRRRIRRAVVPALLCVAVASSPGASFCAGGADAGDWRVSREAAHFRSVATGRFLDVLALAPGMTVLDIGTGTGRFALDFAERLGGTGRVFATDIDNDCIRRVEAEKRRRGLANLHPVLVGPKGVDPFYGRQKYDLITVIHVPIPDRRAFFAEMRGHLADGGRLLVVLYKDAAPFAPQDFGERFPALARALSREPDGSPFRTGLRESTRRLLERAGDLSRPEEPLRTAVAEDFNSMMSDPGFGRQFLEGEALGKELAFTPAERSFADYLLVLLVEERVFEKVSPDKAGSGGEPVRSHREARAVQRFNKLLFLQRFRDCLDAGRAFTPGLTAKMRADFESAGYRLRGNHRDILPFEDILVFTPDPAAGAGRRR